MLLLPLYVMTVSLSWERRAGNATQRNALCCSHTAGRATSECSGEKSLGVFPRAYRLHPCYPGTQVFAQSNTTSSRRSLMPMQCRNTPRAIQERQGCLCFLPHTRVCLLLYVFLCSSCFNAVHALTRAFQQLDSWCH